MSSIHPNHPLDAPYTALHNALLAHTNSPEEITDAEEEELRLDILDAYNDYGKAVRDIAPDVVDAFPFYGFTGTDPDAPLEYLAKEALLFLVHIELSYFRVPASTRTMRTAELRAYLFENLLEAPKPIGSGEEADQHEELLETFMLYLVRTYRKLPKMPIYISWLKYVSRDNERRLEYLKDSVATFLNRSAQWEVAIVGGGLMDKIQELKARADAL
ncbi:hypothetical protein BJ508DRAFT_327250 [Ascobolus immersus RN42]|uniref:Uncharacterized protein n=1 Tax=Ascobolus immersus RN42 TaxID=1160509 RepID=A0A3N4I551_ASCIM|nr:hypothetical protein BJ508DRAFT_327250 [Ascobolus immersus RN42]